MPMNEKAGWSIITASAITLIDVVHRKVGGLLSGGRYSPSHSWNEMIGLIPDFTSLLLITFIRALIYFSLLKSEADFNHPLTAIF